MRALAFALLSLTAALAAGHSHAAASDPPGVTIFAAASLTDVINEIIRRHEGESGRTIKLSFASSSTLARQIENGAPADIFISADEEWMAYLHARQLVATDTWVHPIGNRLVIVAPRDSEIVIRFDKGFDLAAVLGDRRLAVGDPAHVPAGRYARQALEYYGWWSTVEPQLARAENVRAALALVQRGEAPLGIVYATDALATKDVRVVAEFPAESHAPILYSFAAIAARDRSDVRAVLRSLTSADALALYHNSGFVVR